MKIIHIYKLLNNINLYIKQKIKKTIKKDTINLSLNLNGEIN